MHVEMQRAFTSLILLLSLLFCSSLAFSNEPSSPVKQDRMLHIGVSFSIPPWVISETDSGIELDILKQALFSEGYIVVPKYLSFALSYSLFNVGKLDGVINAKESSLKAGYYSDPVVTFQNIAISLEKNNYPSDINLSFLENKSVVAFQKASVLLGDEFNMMTKKNKLYQEVAKQSLQINLLMIRDIDFIILDKSIFGYHWKKAQTDPNLIRAKSKLKRPVRFHYLFEPTDYRFAFKSEKVRDDFNAGLSKLRQNGKYDKIIDKYKHLISLYPEADTE